MNSSTRKWAGAALLLLTVLLVAALQREVPDRSIALGEEGPGDEAAFYGGATITWIVPNSPGGGYDIFSRLIAPYLGKYTGASVRVRNTPGAGGLRGLVDLVGSPPNGLTVALVNGSSLINAKISGLENEGPGIGDLSFIARIDSDVRTLTVTSESGLSSFTEIMNSDRPLKIGATGLGSITYIDAMVIRDVFGLNMDIIHGYDSSAAVRHGMMIGSLDGGWSSWASAREAVESGRNRVVLQGGMTRSADLPEVPTVFEFAEMTADPGFTTRFLDAWETMHKVGRVLVAAPETDHARLAWLRSALEQATGDPGLLEELARSGRTLDYAGGQELEEMMRRALNMAPRIQQVFERAVRSGME